MANFTYNNDIPDTPNNPSNDQPLMKINTNSIDDLIEVDHVSFNTNNGGFHKQSQYLNGNLPAGLGSGAGTVYSKAVSGTSQIFFTPDASGNEYQQTRAIGSSFPLFGLQTNNYNGVGTAFNGGWTYLPGNLLLQYGVCTAVTDTAIPFPVAFTGNPFTIQLTGFYNNNSRGFWWVKTRSNTQFTAALRDSSGSDISTTFFWMAIGV